MSSSLEIYARAAAKPPFDALRADELAKPVRRSLALQRRPRLSRVCNSLRYRSSAPARWWSLSGSNR